MSTIKSAGLSSPSPSPGAMAASRPLGPAAPVGAPMTVKPRDAARSFG